MPTAFGHERKRHFVQLPRPATSLPRYLNLFPKLSCSCPHTLLPYVLPAAFVSASAVHWSQWRQYVAPLGPLQSALQIPVSAEARPDTAIGLVREYLIPPWTCSRHIGPAWRMQTLSYLTITDSCCRSPASYLSVSRFACMPLERIALDTPIMPNIPPELSDYIVDFLYNDPASLRACSLTCRAWVPTARLHLLEKVTLLTPRMCASFDRLMEASPNLGAYVQEFNVAKLTMTGMSAQDKTAALTMAEHVLPRIFTHLSNVRSFSVSCLDVDVAIIISLAQHPSVSELILEYCQFPSFGDFVDLFHSFPQLRNLTMRGVTWRSKELGPRARPESPRLQSVELGKDMDMSTLTRWMVEESLHRDVESLSIACVTEDDVIAAEPFLEALGPALKNLEFHWFCSGMYVTLPSSFTIESCTKLRTLSLHSPVTFDCYALPWITSLLSHIASNDIESIALEVRLLGDLNAINWEGIEELLAEPKFKSLRTLLIKVLLWKGTTEDLAEVKSDIRARLSQLELKGIVRM